LNILYYLARNLRFLVKDLSKNILKALFSSFGIIFLIAFLVMYLSLRQSVKDYIGSNIFGSLAIDEIVLHPRPGAGLEVTVSRENSISPQTVKKVRAMKEFSEVYSLIKTDYVTRIECSVMGNPQTIRVPLYGIETGFLKNKTPNWRTFTDRVPVPVIVPRFGMQFINNYLAQERLPQFTESQLIGFPGMIKITTLDGDDKKSRTVIPASLHSVLGVIDFPGVLVPAAFITSFAQKHRMDSGKAVQGYTCIRLYAKVLDIKKLPELTAQLQKTGLRVESRSDISNKANRAMAIIDGTFLFLGMVMLILTVLSIFNSYLVIAYNRSYDISLKRVIGVSKLRVVFNFVFEAALIGVILGALGYYAGQYLLNLLSTQLAQWIPALKGIVLNRLEGNYLHYAVGFSVVVSSLSALIPAVFASNRNLFRTMVQ
jgi:ABC-type lipoprotein release transport system permease subunit